MLTGILVLVREFKRQPMMDVAFVWTTIEHEFMKSCYPHTLI